VVFLNDKKGKKKMTDLIHTVLTDNILIENRLEWWLKSLNHCLHRDDCYDHILLLKEKAELFTLDLTTTEDCTIIFNEFHHFAPSKKRLEYLRLFDFKPVILRISANTVYGEQYPEEWEREPNNGTWEFYIREEYEIKYDYQDYSEDEYEHYTDEDECTV
jgi:hypothetical protein